MVAGVLESGKGLAGAAGDALTLLKKRSLTNFVIGAKGTARGRTFSGGGSYPYTH